jgi:hypothetical protein
LGKDVEEFTAIVPELKAAIDCSGVNVGSIGRWGPDRIAKDGSIIEDAGPYIGFRNRTRLSTSSFHPYRQSLRDASDTLYAYSTPCRPR